MKDVIERLISEYEEKGDFTYSVPSIDMLTEAEKKLGFKIPSEFLWFLKKYGHGGIGGIEVLGNTKNMILAFEIETIKYRKYGLPENLLVIENCDEWLYCIDIHTNKIIMWSQNQGASEPCYNSFFEYLLDRMKDIIENM